MRERLHHAVVNERGSISELFPHGEIGLGQANEYLAGQGGRGRVIFVGHGSVYQNAQNVTIVHGLEPKEGIQADNLGHGSENRSS